MALVQRDPYARIEIHKRVYSQEMKCSWCGQRGRTWEYWLEHDAGREQAFSGTFCCVSCFRAYHEVDKCHL